MKIHIAKTLDQLGKSQKITIVGTEAVQRGSFKYKTEPQQIRPFAFYTSNVLASQAQPDKPC
jgi:hypothetical protein